MTNTIEQHPFIFSSDKKWRWRRHLFFWGFWWLFQGFLYSFVAAGQGLAYWERLESSMIEALIYLIPHIFLSYSIVYFVIPKFILKQQYLKAAIVISVLFLITAAISAALSLTAIDFVRKCIHGSDNVFVQRHSKVVRVFLAIMAGLRGAITIGGLAGCIKLMKHWYMKEKRNMQLQQQNTEAQLQLLKAQVHPHFLFNTLNNIYSYTYKDAPKAAQVVDGLSSMLRYMLYETNVPLVPLSKELKLIKDYISIESVRYGEKLDVQMNIADNTDELYIAPLMLIPFVENCFKHGVSQMIDNPWISLHIAICDDSTMLMKLVNGKNDQLKSNQHHKGIGIKNVEKRLKLIYAYQYKLDIIDDVDVFIVNLKIQLDKKHYVKGKKVRKVLNEYV
jgi:membrane protein CcdC involved in cytochrome C biogenesis